MLHIFADQTDLDLFWAEKALPDVLSAASVSASHQRPRMIASACHFGNPSDQTHISIQENILFYCLRAHNPANRMGDGSMLEPTAGQRGRKNGDMETRLAVFKTAGQNQGQQEKPAAHFRYVSNVSEMVFIWAAMGSFWGQQRWQL